MKTKRIIKVARVVELAKQKKAIWHERWQKPIPAAFIACMQLRQVVWFIRFGWLYEYQAKPRGATKPIRRQSLREKA